MTIRTYLIDAFVGEGLRGNPAGVCLLESPLECVAMQRIAEEMNQSETAFLSRNESGAYAIRWFTPTNEVDLCGHATLATAQALLEEGRLDRSETVTFDSRSGPLHVRTGDDSITLDFPAETYAALDAESAAIDWKGLFGPNVIEVLRNRMDYVVRLQSADDVRRAAPNGTALSKVKARGAVVTASSDVDAYDIISRAFYPAYGIPEDPVTGSAHCILAPYWAPQIGKNHLTALQASARGGKLDLELRSERVFLTGRCRVALEGRLFV